MLDYLGVVENTWMPPSLSADEIDRLCMDHLMSDKSDMDFLVIIKIEPYIDSLYIHYDDRNDPFAYSARTAHPFRRNGAPFRFKLSKAQLVD